MLKTSELRLKPNVSPPLFCLCCSAIDGVASCPGFNWGRFKEVADKVFQHGITWERIAVLFYVAGKLAVKVGKLLSPVDQNGLCGDLKGHCGSVFFLDL